MSGQPNEIIGGVGKMRPIKRRMKFRDKIIITAIANILLFTVAVFIFSWYDKAIPDSLIISFFGAFFGELGILGLIKVKGS